MNSAEEYHRRFDAAMKRVEKIVERLKETGEYQDISEETDPEKRLQDAFAAMEELAKRLVKKSDERGCSD